MFVLHPIYRCYFISLERIHSALDRICLLLICAEHYLTQTFHLLCSPGKITEFPPYVKSDISILLQMLILLLIWVAKTLSAQYVHD